MPDSTMSTTGRQSFKIKGIIFEAPAPYGEGHVLTAIEARVLNQTFAENLRNNFAKSIDDAAKKEGENLSVETIQKLREDFSEYAEQYEFSERGTRTPVDPVEREATKMATQAVKDALRKKSVDIKTLPEGKLDDLVSGQLEKNPFFREEAHRRIEATKKVAVEALDAV